MATSAITTVLVQKSFEFALKFALESITEKLRKEWSKNAYLQPTNLYKRYLTSLEAHIMVHSLFTKTLGLVNIQKHYVTPNLSRHNSIISFPQFIESARRYRRIAIVAGPGSGKSWLMRFLYTNMAIADSFPLLFDARDLNQSENDVEEYIYKRVENVYGISNRDITKHFVSNGVILLMIDGLDEISPSIKAKTVLGLTRFVSDHEKCRMILTTRPEASWQYLPGFQTYEIAPFNEMQVSDAINKLPCESGERTRFREYVEHLPSEIKDLQSRPLMLAASFIAFNHFSHLPETEYDLLEFTLQALYHRHDGSKGGYVREYESVLTKGQLIQLVEVLAFRLYSRGKDYASEEFLLREVAQIGETLANKEVDARSIMSDLVSGMGILFEDQLYYRFIHRAFLQFGFVKRLAEAKKLEVFSSVYYERFSLSDESFVYKLLKYRHEEVFLRGIMQHFFNDLDQHIGLRGEPSRDVLSYLVIAYVDAVLVRQKLEHDYHVIVTPQGGIMALRDIALSYISDVHREVKVGTKATHSFDEKVFFQKLLLDSNVKEVSIPLNAAYLGENNGLAASILHSIGVSEREPDYLIDAEREIRSRLLRLESL